MSFKQLIRWFVLGLYFFTAGSVYGANHPTQTKQIHIQNGAVIVGLDSVFTASSTPTQIPIYLSKGAIITQSGAELHAEIVHTEEPKTKQQPVKKKIAEKQIAKPAIVVKKSAEIYIREYPPETFFNLGSHHGKVAVSNFQQFFKSILPSTGNLPAQEFCFQNNLKYKLTFRLLTAHLQGSNIRPPPVRMFM